MKQLFGERADLAQIYHDALLHEGIEWGLIGPKEGPRLWERHIANSLPVVSLIPEGASILDIGSGAGLPGIPIALARPDCQVTLLEPLARRTAFLELAASRLDLTNLSIVRSKAQSHKGSYAIVTARAVAPLERLLEWSWHLVAPGGSLLAIKGSNAQEELDQATPALERVRPSSYSCHYIEFEGITGTVIEVAK